MLHEEGVLLMSNRIIKLVIEGSPEERFQVRFADFLRELNLFLQLLNETNKMMQPSGDLSNDYRIIDLSHSSPATVTIEALSKSKNVDLTEKVISEMFTVLREIESGVELQKPLTIPFLVSVRDMSSIVGSSLNDVRIISQENEFSFNKPLSERISKLLRSEEVYPGSVRGMLESINIHNGANVFRIYPDIGASKLSCHFSSEFLEDAIAGVGKYVEVRGVLKYKTTAKYPFHIDADSLIVLPDEDDLPKFNDVFGIAPNATGAMSSEEFIRNIRDASN